MSERAFRLPRLWLNNGWSHRGYVLLRVVFAVYLIVHFMQLLPYAAELFSSSGALPAAASPLLRAFPNVFLLRDDAAFVEAVVLTAILAAVVLGLGRFDRVAAVCLWFIWACLFGRNPLISNPGLPYVGLLLMVHAVRPRTTTPTTTAAIPPPLFAVVWILMAVGYSYSGLTKLTSLSWQDGEAFRAVLESPLARPGAVRDALLALPDLVGAVFSYGALSLELLFAPLSLSKRLRPVLWAAMVAMHLGLIVVVDFADLSLGMVMLHLFTFDPAWLSRRRARPVPGDGDGTSAPRGASGPSGGAQISSA